MKNRLQLIAKWIIRNGVWILFVASFYMVLSAEFNGLCFVKLPFGNETIDKLNGIGKNISLSYIAGVIFYVLSEKVPFIRKRKYRRMKMNAQIERMKEALDTFLESISGDSKCRDEKKIFYEASKKEYEGTGFCEINKSHLLSIRKLLAELDDALDILISSDVYLGERDYQTVIEIKTDPSLSIIRQIAQIKDETQIEQKTLYDLLSGVINIIGKVNQIELGGNK